MKVILSRKGFDSATGGMPSPLLPDGTLLSLPIPARVGPHRFCDIRTPTGMSYARVLRELGWKRARFSLGRRANGDICHLDPDLRFATTGRAPGWRPAFGQVGVGQTQLQTPGPDRRGIAPGDLFLFFGWFRAAERLSGRLRFSPGTSAFHALFGWLRVGHIVTLNNAAQRGAALGDHPWLATHPHACDADYWAQRICRNGDNRIYLSANGAGAAGTFRFAPSVRLTADGMSASRWKLWPWLRKAGNARLSRCSDAARLDRAAGIFDTHAGRWQEMVVDVAQHPGVEAWATRLISDYGEAGQ